MSGNYTITSPILVYRYLLEIGCVRTAKILRHIKSCKSNLKIDPRGEMLMMVSKYLDKRLANHVSLNHQKYHTKPHIESKEDMEFQAGMNVLETINDTMCMKIHKYELFDKKRKIETKEDLKLQVGHLNKKVKIESMENLEFEAGIAALEKIDESILH